MKQKLDMETWNLPTSIIGDILGGKKREMREKSV